MTTEQTAPGSAPACTLAEGVVRQAVGDEMVLLDTSRQLYFGLDAVGAHMVARLTMSSWGEALGTLARDYAVDPATLESDVRDLVTQLQAAGLVRSATDG